MRLQFPASRETDPISSHEAEREINRTGSRSAQQEVVFEAVRRNPGCTSKELTRHCELDRYQIARRLADLENAELVIKGTIRRCSVGRRSAVTWYCRKPGQMELF